MPDNKSQILRNAAPKTPTHKPAPAKAAAPAPAPVVAPAPAAPVVDPDQDQIDRIVNQQHTAIVENLRRAKIAKAAQAAVEAKLKAEGISLDDINAGHLAQQHLADLETQVQEAAAKAKAKELFKAKYGHDFTP